ncbi:MAG TPA: glycosyltransferase [Pyrinomonadaceae bacterium]
MNAPDVSVVVPTYNRSALLQRALLSLFSQQPDRLNFEIIVIDNNSSDDTSDVVAAMQAKSPVNLRLVRETRQGNAYARNAGIDAAQAPIIAFLDDDVVADKNWVQRIKTAFDRDPQLAFVGGRVLPLWDTEPPSWLNESHWAPLALLDYGHEQRTIAGDAPLGLLTANMGVRREVFDEVGRFSPALQRVKGSIGSMEDHEFLLRMCRSGKSGIYLPELITRGAVEPERLTKAYHRRWHTGHGRFYAVMNDPEWERSSFRLLGVPGHLYREAANNALTWFSRTLTGNKEAAFLNECRLRFFGGFFVQRSRSR